MRKKAKAFKSFKCVKCGVEYEEKKWADACLEYCKTHNGVCSLEIIKHASQRA